MARGGRLAAAAAFAWFLSSCDHRPAPVTGTIAARPAVWEVTQGDNRAYLLGTVHQLPPGIDWNDGAVRLAIDRADRLMVELAPSEQARAAGEFRRLAAPTTDLPPVAERLPAELRPALTLLLGRARLRRRMLDESETWAAALVLAQAQAREGDLSVLRGVDAVLATRFEIADKPIIGFETATGQLRLFDTLSENEQRAMLEHVVRTAARGDAAERMRAIIDAWAKGDLAMLQAKLADDLASSDTLRRRLIDVRNAAWSRSIVAALSRPLAAGDDELVLLIAVGAGGLPDRLRDMGMTVRRVQ